MGRDLKCKLTGWREDERLKRPFVSGTLGASMAWLGEDAVENRQAVSEGFTGALQSKVRPRGIVNIFKYRLSNTNDILQLGCSCDGALLDRCWGGEVLGM